MFTFFKTLRLALMHAYSWQWENLGSCVGKRGLIGPARLRFRYTLNQFSALEREMYRSETGTIVPYMKFSLQQRPILLATVFKITVSVKTYL